MKRSTQRYARIETAPCTDSLKSTHHLNSPTINFSRNLLDKDGIFTDEPEELLSTTIQNEKILEILKTIR